MMGLDLVYTVTLSRDGEPLAVWTETGAKNALRRVTHVLRKWDGGAEPEWVRDHGLGVWMTLDGHQMELRVTAEEQA